MSEISQYYGTIETFRSEIDFKAGDLAAVLDLQPYSDLEPIGSGKVTALPDSPYLVRRNGTNDRLPKDMPRLKHYLGQYYAEIDAVRKCDIEVIPHTIFVSSLNDDISGPGVFTITERVPFDGTLDYFIDCEIDEVQDTILHVGHALLRYYTRDKPQSQFIDDIDCLSQYTNTGALIDLDPYLDVGTHRRLVAVRRVIDNVANAMLDGPERNAFHDECLAAHRTLQLAQ